MTDDDKIDVARRLMAMQGSLRSLTDSCEDQALLCEAAGAPGLAFAVHMLRESLAAYSVELNRWVTGLLAED